MVERRYVFNSHGELNDRSAVALVMGSVAKMRRSTAMFGYIALSQFARERTTVDGRQRWAKYSHLSI